MVQVFICSVISNVDEVDGIISAVVFAIESEVFGREVSITF